MKLLWTLLSATALLAAVPGLARADALEDAKAHFKAGTDAYRKADYTTAIHEFDAAYQARPAGVLRYNIAQCYEKLGDIPSALRNYHLYLRETPNAEDKATVETAIANLEKRLQQKGVQQLVVYSEPSGATVSVDGVSHGASPMSVELAPGQHEVKVEAPGFAPDTRKVTIAADRSLELSVALHATADLTPRADAHPEEKHDGPAGGLNQNVSPEPHRVYTWVAAGVAAAAIAGGVVMGISAQNNANTLHDASKHSGVTSLGTLNTNAYNSAHTQQMVSNVCYGVGAVAGVAAVTLFFVEGSF
ncbi:MAG: PEGA domain-containing protein [Deltaproteobacteria bacterium]|nr:PEGA domain-containing protein [Deltaproteobacteria bacterium]